MSRADDEGQELAERELSNAECAYVQYRKEKHAFEEDLKARLQALPRGVQNDARWELSVEWAAWVKANEVPEPPRRVYTGPKLVTSYERHGRTIGTFADRQAG